MSSSFPGRIIFFNIKLFQTWHSTRKNLWRHFYQNLHTKKRASKDAIECFFFSHAWTGDLLFCGVSLDPIYTLISKWLLRVTVNWNENIPLQYLWVWHFLLSRFFFFFKKEIYIKIFLQLNIRWFFMESNNLKLFNWH